MPRSTSIITIPQTARWRSRREQGAVVRHEYKQGKGNVIRRMFQEIDAQCYIMVDGDDTYPMENAREMADLVLDHNADMVVGDRLSSTYFEENKSRFTIWETAWCALRSICCSNRKSRIS